MVICYEAPTRQFITASPRSTRRGHEHVTEDVYRVRCSRLGRTRPSNRTREKDMSVKRRCGGDITQGQSYIFIILSYTF